MGKAEAYELIAAADGDAANSNDAADNVIVDGDVQIDVTPDAAPAAERVRSYNSTSNSCRPRSRGLFLLLFMFPNWQLKPHLAHPVVKIKTPRKDLVLPAHAANDQQLPRGSPTRLCCQRCAMINCTSRSSDNMRRNDTTATDFKVVGVCPRGEC